MTEILAINGWRNNAELIADVARLGYLPGPVLDVTYGKGTFWKVYRPTYLDTSDLDGASPAENHWDFTDLPMREDQYRSVVFDPPYKLNGTSVGTGPGALDGRYGVAVRYTPVEERHALMVKGLIECIRVCRPGGFVLAKCQDQISSGRFWRQTSMLHLTAEMEGAEQVDEFLLQGGRKQPDGRTQKHARRNYSTLMVFRKRRKR